MNRFRYRFRRADSPIVLRSSTCSFLSSQVNIGDPIVVSDEQGHFGLANGFISNIQPDSLCVHVDRRLHGARQRQLGFDATNNQVFDGIAELSEVTSSKTTHESAQKTTVTYRVDKDEFKSGMALARNNLLQLFTKTGDSKRRELIVQGREPVFIDHDGTQHSYFKKHQHELNTDQRNAMQKVLTGQPIIKPCSY